MIYVFLADGFETVEALAPVDVMRRAGLEVATVSITEEKRVASKQGIPVLADITIDEVNENDAEMLMLPGGLPGADNLFANEKLKKMLLSANEKGKYVAAICAAPYILGQLGILKGKKATCYPGFEDKLIGAEATGERVVLDKNVLTGIGMGAAVEFGLEAVSIFAGEEAKDKISKGIIQK